MNPDHQRHFLTALEALPDAMQAGVMATWEQVADSLPNPRPDQPDWLSDLPAVLSCSDFIAGLLRRDVSYLGDLLGNGELFSHLDIVAMRQRLARELAATDDENRLMSLLRRERNRALLQIAFRDLAGWADLNEVLDSLSRCADVLLSETLQRCTGLLSSRYGYPIGEDSGSVQQMVVFGMGKLGGGELNFSSDVDLIFCFPEHGQTNGAKSVANSEYFLRLARLFIKLIGQVTADGFVYRVDTRLRPNGDSGPLVLSFAAMDTYYQAHGRDWERYAWIKARVVAGDVDAGDEILALLRPFIYRKYFDFAALESIRDMKEMIERELARKQDVWKNVKLGPGGIREVEFIAQAHQLIRGGRVTRLQQRSLLKALDVLRELNIISRAEHQSLLNAYDFLRRTENRLQIKADQQTQTLPEASGDQLRLAHSMGFANWDDFLIALKHHMQQVHGQFHELFMETATPDADAGTRVLAQLWQGEMDDSEALQLLAENDFEDTRGVLDQLKAWRHGSAYRNLSTTARSRLDRLLPVLLQECGQSDAADETLNRLIRFLAAISRRPVYLSLLLDNGAIRQRLIHLVGASAWVANWLTRHPILLDDLLTGYDDQSFTLQQLARELDFHLSGLDAEDLEQQMIQLREFRHARVLGVASQDLAGQFDAPQIGVALSNIAETCVRTSVTISAQAIMANHGLPNGIEGDALPFTVIGYGKLGGRELGYGSDLDLVFLSGDIEETVKTNGDRPIYSSQFFARIGQRFVHIMTTRTHAGQLYEVDMRLRPNGQSGPLVATLRAFERYQQDKAWTWEHQALVRARAVAGDPAIAERFDAIRHAILTRQRDAAALRDDVVAMREKMRAAAEPVGDDRFQLKQGHGGIVDIEFMVQYMVLRWAHEYPALTAGTGTCELLDGLQEQGLIDQAWHDDLVDAYQQWMRLSYKLTLADKAAIIPAHEHAGTRQRVTAIWEQMFQ